MADSAIDFKENDQNLSPAKKVPLWTRLGLIMIIWIVGGFSLNFMYIVVQNVPESSAAYPDNVFLVFHLAMAAFAVVIFVFTPVGVLTSNEMKYNKVLMTRPMSYYRKSGKYVIVDEDYNPVDKDRKNPK